MMRNVIGVDLGGTNIRFGLVTEEGEILRRLQAETKSTEGKNKVIAKIKHGIDILLVPEKEKIAGIGVGCPGPLDSRKGIIFEMPNLRGWKRVALKKMLEKEFKLPVKIQNDANCSALGEHWIGAGRDVKTMIHLTLGTGIGGGIILNDQLWIGRDSCAGELGHITISLNGPKCACGNYGCIEAYAAAQGIVRRFKERLKAGARSSLKKKIRNEKIQLTPRLIYLAAKNGDRLSKTIIEETGQYLGIAIASYVNIFNPEMVVLSGGIAQAGKLLFDAIKKEVKKRALAAMTKNLKIVKSELGDDSGILGAVKSLLNYLDNMQQDGY